MVRSFSEDAGCLPVPESVGCELEQTLVAVSSPGMSHQDTDDQAASNLDAGTELDAGLSRRSTWSAEASRPS